MRTLVMLLALVGVCSCAYHRVARDTAVAATTAAASTAAGTPRPASTRLDLPATSDDSQSDSRSDERYDNVRPPAHIKRQSSGADSSSNESDADDRDSRRAARTSSTKGTNVDSLNS